MRPTHMAGGARFERTLAESKSAVLPIERTPNKAVFLQAPAKPLHKTSLIRFMHYCTARLTGSAITRSNEFVSPLKLPVVRDIGLEPMT